MPEEVAKSHHLEQATEYLEKARRSIASLNEAKQTDPGVLHALQNLSNATEAMNEILKQWWPRMNK